MTTTLSAPAAVAVASGTNHRPRRSRAGMGTLLGAALAVAALVFGPASPAFAHDQLVGTSPGEGAVLEAAPEKITLSFNNTIIEVGTVVNVTAPDGSSVVSGEPQVAGAEVHQMLLGDLPDGSYQVVWRVVSSDGHPISGLLSFAIGAPSSNAGAPVAPDASKDAEAEHSHDEADGHGDESHDDADETMHTMTDDSASGSPWLWIGLGAAGVLAIGAIVLAVRAAKRRAASLADATGEATNPGDSSDADRSAGSGNSGDSGAARE